MKPALVLALFAAVLLAVLAFFFARGDEAPAIAESGPSAAQAPAARPRVELETARAPLAEPRRESQTVPPEPSASSATPTEPFRVRGTVCDLDGLAVARVSIATDDGTVLAQASADGAFELELDRDVLLVARSPAHVTVRAAHARATAPNAELRVVVAPKLALAGRVVDEQGAPIAGAKLACRLPDLLFARIPFPLDHSSAWFASERDAESDNSGRFAFASFPEIPGALLDVEAKGFRPLSLHLDESRLRGELVVTLSRPPAGAPALEGVVRHHDGTPARGATVRVDSYSTSPDDDGEFRIELAGSLSDRARLVAALRGFQPAVEPGVAAWLALAPEQRAPLRLVLGPAALTITGRVRDASGAAAANWHVDLLDGTELSTDRVPPEFAEAVAGGERAVRARTDSAGRFELGGLVEREYRVLVWDERTLQRFESAPIGAGARDVELVAPADGVWPKLAGTVVGFDGRPIAGLEVALGVVLFQNDVGSTSQSGRSAVTDAAGRFSFEKVAWRSAFLSLSGDAILPERIELSEDVARDALTLRVGRRVNFRIETTRPPEEHAANIEFLRADGAAADVFTLQSSSWMSSSSIDLAAGRSQVHCLVEGVYTLVFHREDGLEFLRRELALSPGDVQVIEY
ncbi:MAG: carboxypeptidase regulatory-like domain-containing protein [Planctomycetes bacterium]|nr:carboxypeptidase regulatory-like domain-containing protein [Planctomycetota bacterium]